MFSSSSSALSDTNFSPSPPTQGSGIPGGYLPYLVDMQNAPNGQYGWTPEYGSTKSLSQLLEGNTRNTGSHSVRSGGDGGDPNVRTTYTPLKMEKMFEAYVAVSEYPEVGTNQTGGRLWGHIAHLYNTNRSGGMVECNESMLCNAVERASEEIQKFRGFYLEEQRSAGNDSNEVNVITAAMSVYVTMLHKPCWSTCPIIRR